ncbi:hypothetical protein ACUJ46_05720 [Sandaracinobacteroides sp. A072]|uniref:hypothetical protein n=1 Tax=Sandaracinobacteroides sp. A072 TaxID=3461146 RepID=UPI0040410408
MTEHTANIRLAGSAASQTYVASTLKAALALSVAFGLAACGSQEKTVAKTEDAEVTTTGDGSYKVETADGTTATITTPDSANLPESAASVLGTMPAHAPVYPGSKIVTTMEADDGKGGKGRVIVLETADPFDKVIGFYDERIAASGVSQTMKMDQPGSAMRAVGEKDGKTGTIITISDGGESRTISITTGAEG